MTRAMSYLIATQFQAIALLGAAWWAGDWLNRHEPKGFNWYAVTFPIAVIAIAQTFYVVIRKALLENKAREKAAAAEAAVAKEAAEKRAKDAAAAEEAERELARLRRHKKRQKSDESSGDAQ